MSKRKLTHNQRRHTQRIQEKRLERAAKQESREETTLGTEQKGLVVTRFGKTVDVEGADGEIVRCKLRQNIGELVCGDRVIWQAENETSGVICAVMPRHSLLARPDFQGRKKLIAANIDQIMITCATYPEISPGLIDRYLVAAEATGITPVIVVNKTDLITEQSRPIIEKQLAIYHQLGYQVIYTSAVILNGMDELIKQLKDHISIFVGHSGVGKSSLIKILFPEQVIRIAALSERSGKGRHTTTASTLYHLPQGGDLIDSPGIREFGLWEITEQQVAEGFLELEPYIGNCRFRNCRHQAEPGCAIQVAADSGAITPRRINSFYRMVASLTEK
ncbi:MAG: small ribosomal subunit biogenesis GTPase RsgA [Gammaproteobacteria bacterium]|nr:small ribosomal subunit biogenesis GTPase RsgA [Gammaproteobacteria bacterium]MCF6231250.1 small ribosomal subunit biogenesis GTPase RsgA [Gammaproteobacteria bacterium]